MLHGRPWFHQWVPGSPVSWRDGAGCAPWQNEKQIPRSVGGIIEQNFPIPSQAEHGGAGMGHFQVHPAPAMLLPLLHLVRFYFLSLQHFLMMKKQAGWAFGERDATLRKKIKSFCKYLCTENRRNSNEHHIQRRWMCLCAGRCRKGQLFTTD